MIIDNLFNPKRTVVEGSAANDYFTRRKSEEERIAGTRAPAKNKKNPANTDYAKKRKQQDVAEVAPPGDKAERMVKHIKAGYAKDGKLTPKEKGIAFATAWKAHNAGRVEESDRPFRGTGGRFNRGDDERHDLDPTDWYIVKDGKMFAASIYPRQVQQAEAEGFCRTKAEARARASSQDVDERIGDLRKFAHKKNKFRSLDKLRNPLGEEGMSEGSLNEFATNDNDDDDYDDEEDDFPEMFEAPFTAVINGKKQTGTVIIYPGEVTSAEWHLKDAIYIKTGMDNVYNTSDFITHAAEYIQEIIKLDGRGHNYVKHLKRRGRGVAEGLGKDIKRLATGKDVKSRAGQEIAKSQDASMKGDTKTSKKHFDRYDKLDKLANKGVAEGLAADDSVNYTLGHTPDSEYVYSIYRDGKKEGTYHSVDQAKRIVANMKKSAPYRKYKITRSPRSKMAGPIGQLPESGVAEGVVDTIKKVGKALAKPVKDPILNQMKDIHSAAHKREIDAQNKKYAAKGKVVSENAEDLHIGDPVIITGNGIKFEGATGEIVDFGRDHRFVVVNLYNHGRHSFHSSDVSFNEYAGSDDEEARMYDAGEFGDDPRDEMDEAGNANSGRRGPNSTPVNMPVKPGRIEKLKTGIKHHADSSRYGGYEPEHDDDQLLTTQQRWRLNKAVTPDHDMDEARMSAAQRLSNAWDKQRAKSDASLRRTPSSIPKTVDKERMIRDIATSDASPEHKKVAIDAVMKTMSESRVQRQQLLAQMLKGR